MAQRKRKYPVRLTSAQVTLLQELLHRSTSKATQRRAQILLYAHQGLLDTQIEHLTGASATTIRRTRHRFAQDGLEASLLLPTDDPLLNRVRAPRRIPDSAWGVRRPPKGAQGRELWPPLRSCQALAAALLLQALRDLPRRDARSFLHDPGAMAFFELALDISAEDLERAVHRFEAGEIDLDGQKTHDVRIHTPTGAQRRAIHGD
jgi:hypothetical protein